MSRYDPDAFNDEWRASKFVVVWRGEANEAHVLNNWSEVERHIEAMVGYELNALQYPDEWCFDDNEKPFAFNEDIGEMSSVYIVRLSKFPPDLADADV